MNSIRVDIRLRPIRFGFIVRPDDQAKILEIFRINTCLWGGMFNPIIPFFEEVPSWWERGDDYCENAKQIINGYLNFFEPDFLVEADEGLAEELGFDSERVLQLTDILEDPGKGGWDKYGLSVHDLYWKLYDEEFQFKSRHKHNIVHVEAANSSFDGFVAAHFGSFPVQKQFGYFKDSYKKVFNPGNIILDPLTFLGLYKSGWVFPLEIGRQKFQIDYHDRLDLTLFVLNMEKPEDLVDFWNLRSISPNVIAVPRQWIKELSPFYKKFILKNYRSISIFSRSIPDSDIKDLHKDYLQVDTKMPNALPTRYPSIWRKPSEQADISKRPTLEAGDKSVDIQIHADNPEIRFNPLFPEFAPERGNAFRIANIIRLQSWSNEGQIATVFPCNYKNPSFPNFSKSLLPTTEGLVTFPKYRNASERWRLVDGITAFNQWFHEKGISATLSDAGRATEQIIQTLGGIVGVHSVAHKGVIELLNKMAKRSVTKTETCQNFQKKIYKAIDNENAKEAVFRTLVERNAVELGLELKCNECGDRSWYSVKQLDYSLTCSFCLKQFDFPVTEPENNRRCRWAYRVIGPFALPDYAKGGYAAALAIRFFASVVGEVGDNSETTWSSGQEMAFSIDEKVEADFMLWHQRKRISGSDYPTETVFGEAKSFAQRAFVQDDVDRMQLIAKAFPGSILVFATMKEIGDFTKGEINRIKELAKWGREYDRDRQQSRAPVIVLTHTELFATDSFSEAWRKKGGQHEALIKRGIRTDSLRVLADLTQQLYLGMRPC